MNKKTLLFIFLVIITLGLSSCNSDTPVSVERNDINQSALSTEQTIESSSQLDSSLTEPTDTTLPETTENPVEEIVEPLWYMDSDGLKNDSLGIQIKKKNGLLDLPSVYVHYMIYTLETSETTGESFWLGTQTGFRCYYSDDDIDEYISKTEGYSKGTWNGNSYAYIINTWGIEINFIGNGVRISTTFDCPDTTESITDWETYINDCLTSINLITPYDNSPINCLAFIAKDGLYCPALNIKIAKHSEAKARVEGLEVSCQNDDEYLDICDESISRMYYMTDATCALDVLNNYINENMQYIAIEETAEVTLGKNTFLGRGIYKNTVNSGRPSDYETWLFYSDTSDWSISLEYKRGDNYQKYLNAISPLE